MVCKSGKHQKIVLTELTTNSVWWWEDATSYLVENQDFQILISMLKQDKKQDDFATLIALITTQKREKYLWKMS
jgi:hypothetical protein